MEKWDFKARLKSILTFVIFLHSVKTIHMKLRTRNRNYDRRRLFRYFCIYSKDFQRHAFLHSFDIRNGFIRVQMCFFHALSTSIPCLCSLFQHMLRKCGENLIWLRLFCMLFFLLPFTVFIFISVSFSSQHHLLYGCIFHTRTQNTFYMLFCIRKIRCETFVIGHKDLNIHFGIHLQYRQRQSIVACCCFTLHRNDIYRRYQLVKCFHFLG